MHAVVTTIAVAVVAFVGTMVDNFVAFAAQLALTEPRRQERAMSAQVLGVVTLIVISAGVGSALAEIPVRWVGLLAALPVALAIHAWRTRHEATRRVRRGATTTFIVTIALGGDNLAVWIPLLRAGGLQRSLLSAGVFILCDVGLVALAKVLISRPRVVGVAEKYAKVATPVLYVTLGFVILWQCHLL